MPIATDLEKLFAKASVTDVECQCPKCGRLHRSLRAGTPPLSVRGLLSHDDLCRLSRLFNKHSNLGTGQDHRINEWLKARIAEANSDKP